MAEQVKHDHVVVAHYPDGAVLEVSQPTTESNAHAIKRQLELHAPSGGATGATLTVKQVERR